MTRPAILLLILAALIIAASWNAAAVLDALIAIYSNDTARRAIAGSWLLIGLALGIGALAMISRAAYRQVEKDFPEQTGIGAVDAERLKRNKRNG